MCPDGPALAGSLPGSPSVPGFPASRSPAAPTPPPTTLRPRPLTRVHSTGRLPRLAQSAGSHCPLPASTRLALCPRQGPALLGKKKAFRGSQRPCSGTRTDTREEAGTRPLNTPEAAPHLATPLSLPGLSSSTPQAAGNATFPAPANTWRSEWRHAAGGRGKGGTHCLLRGRACRAARGCWGTLRGEREPASARRPGRASP